jgi:hypothetical protein
MVYFLDISQVSGTREFLLVANIEEGWEIFARFFFGGIKFMLKNYLLKNVTFFSQ